MTAEVREHLTRAFESLGTAYTVGARDVPDSLLRGTVRRLRGMVEGIMAKGPVFVMGAEHLFDACGHLEAAESLLPE